MKRDNHYEAAFEAFARTMGVGVVPVDEARRSYLDIDSVKSPDFLVVGPNDARLVVDVKGRKFPGGTREHPRLTWQNWCEAADVDALIRWSERLGPGFRGLLAFVYHIDPCIDLPVETPNVFTFRDSLYLMRAVLVSDYRSAMRTRSPRWGTVHLPTAAFRQVVKPFSHFLSPARVEFSEFAAENAEYAEN
ncbi:MAG TPA: HYExAFE family protein [Gemmata sp.]|nr:HYExAFE family protein [Gemmata sp.]